ncbi:MAG: ATP-binding cassette domain-containing protein [bacterium]
MPHTPRGGLSSLPKSYCRSEFPHGLPPDPIRERRTISERVKAWKDPERLYRALDALPEKAKMNIGVCQRWRDGHQNEPLPPFKQMVLWNLTEMFLPKAVHERLILLDNNSTRQALYKDQLDCIQKSAEECSQVLPRLLLHKAIRNIGMFSGVSFLDWALSTASSFSSSKFEAKRVNHINNIRRYALVMARILDNTYEDNGLHPASSPDKSCMTLLNHANNSDVLLQRELEALATQVAILGSAWKQPLLTASLVSTAPFMGYFYKKIKGKTREAFTNGNIDFLTRMKRLDRALTFGSDTDIENAYTDAKGTAEDLTNTLETLNSNRSTIQMFFPMLAVGLSKLFAFFTTIPGTPSVYAITQLMGSLSNVVEAELNAKNSASAAASELRDISSALDELEEKNHTPAILPYPREGMMIGSIQVPRDGSIDTVAFPEQLIRPGSLTFLFGPSGIGKSTTVKTLLARYGSEVAVMQPLNTKFKLGEIMLKKFDNGDCSYFFDFVERNHEKILTVAKESSLDSTAVDAMKEGLQRLARDSTNGEKQSFVNSLRASFLFETSTSPSMATCAITAFIQEFIPDFSHPKLALRSDILSLGERRRVEVLLPLMSGPKLLILDEPDGNLDEDSASNMQVRLKEFLRHGTTAVLVVTHNPILHESLLRDPDIYKKYGGDFMMRYSADDAKHAVVNYVNKDPILPTLNNNPYILDVATEQIGGIEGARSLLRHVDESLAALISIEYPTVLGLRSARASSLLSLQQVLRTTLSHYELLLPPPQKPFSESSPSLHKSSAYCSADCPERVGMC